MLTKGIRQMAIKVFADGANLEGMLDMYENGNVQGFTTNPSLMKKGGVTDCQRGLDPHHRCIRVV